MPLISKMMKIYFQGVHLRYLLVILKMIIRKRTQILKIRYSITEIL